MDGESTLDSTIGSESPIRAAHTLITHNADITLLPPVNRISDGDILLELVVLCLLFHGQSVSKELLVFALGPVRELVMADLVGSSGVPGPFLNKCIGALPVREPEGELVTIDVRLAEVGAVLDELLHVAVLDLLIDEGSCLLSEGLDLLSGRWIALFGLIGRLLARLRLGLLGFLSWSLLWLLLFRLFGGFLSRLCWLLLWLFWLFRLWLFGLGFFRFGLRLLGFGSFWLLCLLGSNFLGLSRR